MFDTVRVTDAPPRMIAVWCPDWPVTAARIEAGLPAEDPVAVFTANRVVACSYPARLHLSLIHI